MSERTVLVINAGSSSIKFALYAGQDKLCAGAIGGIGGAANFRYSLRDGEKGEAPLPAANNHRAALDALVAWLQPRFDSHSVAIIGHRVVHGGTRYFQPVIIDTAVMDYLRSIIPLAPLHQPHSIAGINSLRAHFPGVPQVACFDTGFHRTQPECLARYALPEEWYQRGVRRYGFHGLSYEYISQRLRLEVPQLAKGKVIVAHLGNGASMCAMHNGKSVDTTMGFSSLEGLPMGTRCGSLDPGIALYMLGEYGMPLKELEALLYKKSGLLGLSGVSNDVRVLLATDKPRAKMAIDIFTQRISRELGALAAMLGGLDGLVFTAGIGEHRSVIREQVCDKAAWLGVELDSAANAAGNAVISKTTSQVQVMVIPTDEERVIAQHCATFV